MRGRRSTIVALFSLALVSVLAVAGWALKNEIGTPEPPDPLDPDPLETSESVVDDTIFEPPAKAQSDHAVTIALSDPDVQEVLLGERYRAVYVVFPEAPSTKGDTSDCLPDCIEVTFYVYSTDQTVTVLVGTVPWTVIDFQVGTGRPPLSQDELEAAHVLAELDSEVVNRLGGRPHSHPVLAYPMYPDQGPCASSRCATVAFYLGATTSSEATPLLLGLVNLSRERIERITIT